MLYFIFGTSTILTDVLRGARRLTPAERTWDDRVPVHLCDDVKILEMPCEPHATASRHRALRA